VMRLKLYGDIAVESLRRAHNVAKFSQAHHMLSSTNLRSHDVAAGSRVQTYPRRNLKSLRPAVLSSFYAG
jgi:hypothetical protein